MNACSQTFSIHRKDLLGCQILNIIYWKRDKIKPNLKNKQEKKVVAKITHNFILKSSIKSVPVVIQLKILPQQPITVKEKTQ